MAAIGIGLLSVVVMNANKIAKKNSQNIDSDRDIDQAMATLLSLFSTPPSCNLALQGKSFSAAVETNLNSLKRNIADSSFTIKTNDYDIFDQKSRGETPRMKLKVALSYKLAVPQSTSSTGVRPRTAVTLTSPVANYYPGNINFQPAILNVYARFTKKIDGAGVVNIKERIVSRVYSIDVYVVTSTYNFTTFTLTDSPTIIGCARSPSSTMSF